MTGEFTPLTNTQLAEKLEMVSALLLEQGANRFRALAWGQAATSIRNLEKPLWQIYQSAGIFGLEEIPGVGRTISRALQQLIRGGQWPLLQRLQGQHAVEQAFASVPSIGPGLAKRIHEELHIETLAELQAAAWDGRLKAMAGVGEKRLRAVRESLAARGRRHPDSPEFQQHVLEGGRDLTGEIPVSEILDIDDEYRFKAARHELPRVAPRKNNPHVQVWLPILHTEREDRHYTALFSNTDHAHAMGTTHDWVVIYLEDHRHNGQHGRWTVITSRFGKLIGKRIVRGREQECVAFYSQRVS